MKTLKSLLFVVPFVLFAMTMSSDRVELVELSGGSAFAQDPQEPVDPKPKYKSFKCVDHCGDAGSCAASNCQPVGGGICSRVAKEFSGKCEGVKDTSGPLETCTTVSANDFCYKDYRSRCTPESITCTTFQTGCGTAYKCQ